MACPNCKCKVTYAYYEDDTDPDTDLEGCANCSFVFYSDQGLDDEDD